MNLNKSLKEIIVYMLIAIAAMLMIWCGVAQSAEQLYRRVKVVFSFETRQDRREIVKIIDKHLEGVKARVRKIITKNPGGFPVASYRVRFETFKTAEIFFENMKGLSSIKSGEVNLFTYPARETIEKKWIGRKDVKADTYTIIY